MLVLVRQSAWAGAPAAVATCQYGACSSTRNGKRSLPLSLVLAAGLVLLATATTCLTAERSLAQQSSAAETTLPTDPALSTQGAEAPGAGQRLPDSESSDDTWPPESDPLQGLFDDTGGETLRPSTSTRPRDDDDPIDEIKSLLKEIDPRESLDFELPEALKGGAASDSASRDDSSAPSPDAARAGGSRDGFGGTSRDTAPPPQSRTTIGELQSLFVEIFSDFRIYAYLLLSLGAVVGVFVIAIAIKRSRARRQRRLARRRGRHRSRSRSRRRLAHS